MKKTLIALLSVGLILTTACGGDANFSFTKNKAVTEETGNLKLNYALADLVKLGKYKEIKLYKKESASPNDKQVLQKMAIEADSFKDKFTTDNTKVIENGDIINIDFEGFIDGAKESLDSTRAKSFVLGIGSGAFIEGFEDQIVGHHVGESNFDINVKFPENYQTADMAGKPARFVITINGVITDKDVATNTDVKTIAEWKEKVKADMISQMDKKAEQTLKNEALTAVAQYSMVRRFPDKLVEDAKNDLIEYIYKPYAESMGVTIDDLEQYGVTDETLTSGAQNHVFSKMIVTAIAKNEKITVTADEYHKAEANMIGEGKTFADKKAFDDAGAYETVLENLLTEKVMDFIVANADVKTVSEDEYNKLKSQGVVDASDEETADDEELDIEEGDTTEDAEDTEATATETDTNKDTKNP